MSNDAKATLEKLSGSERFILKWLSREDTNAHGECESMELRVLTNMGLATVTETPGDRGNWPVSLTDHGYEVAKLLP